MSKIINLFNNYLAKFIISRIQYIVVGGEVKLKLKNFAFLALAKLILGCEFEFQKLTFYLDFYFLVWIRIFTILLIQVVSDNF